MAGARPVTSALHRYRRLLVSPAARSALVLGTLARLPIGMTALAVLLLVQQETGSIARGSLVSAAYSAAVAVTAPLRGREVDRRGARAVLRRYGLVHPLLLLAVPAAVLGAAPLPLVLLLAVLAGGTFPPVGPLVRSVWGLLFDGTDRTSAYALDAVLVEVAFVGGPLVVGVAVTAGSAGWAVALSALFVAAGGLGLSASPAARLLRPSGQRDPMALSAPLSTAAVRRLLLAVVVLGAGFGALEVSVAAFVLEQGRPGLAGPLLAVWALGSVLGGLGYGGREWTAPVQRQYPGLVALLAVGLALPLLAWDSRSLAVLLLLAGAGIAPFSACNSALLAGAAPPGAATATFAWSGSAIVSGIALGTAVAGLLSEARGASAGFLLAAACGALALLVARTGRSAQP